MGLDVFFGVERKISLGRFFFAKKASVSEWLRELTTIRRLFIPVEERFMQHIYVIEKKEDGTVEKQKEYGVHYVPLTDAPKE